MDNNLFYRSLDSLSEKVDEHHELFMENLKEIKDDIKDIKKIQETDVVQLKLQSASCDHKWSLLGKVASFFGLSTLFGTIFTKFFGGH